MPTDCQARSLADLLKMRQLNAELLFNLLPAERKHAVWRQWMSILIYGIEEENNVAMRLSPEDVTTESRTATTVGVKRIVGALDNEVHVTERRRFEASHARLMLESAPDCCIFQSATWRSSCYSLDKCAMG